MSTKFDSTDKTAKTELSLYTFYRSSAAYRVRIALALKGLGWSALPVNLAKGEQRQAEYLEKNPQGLLPALISDQGMFTQSLAIIEYLEECYPRPALLPDNSFGRAIVRGMAQQIAMEIHPLNNLRVLNYLTEQLGHDETQKLHWYQHWIEQGFRALETALWAHSDGDFCYGDAATLADVCLIPQVYNAQRFNCPLGDFPLINAIVAHCLSITAFQSAAPESQVDMPNSRR